MNGIRLCYMYGCNVYVFPISRTRGAALFLAPKQDSWLSKLIDHQEKIVKSILTPHVNRHVYERVSIGASHFII